MKLTSSIGVISTFNGLLSLSMQATPFQIFNAMKEEGSDLITFESIKNLSKELGVVVYDSEINKMMEMVDKDKKISLMDFLRVYDKYKPKEKGAPH
jgi:Ca2+-binding EF-hand superfamily protein